MKIAQIARAKKVRGQGMSEYVIIVALIAVAAIAVTGLFGGAARSQFAGIASELAGDETGSGNAITNAQTAAGAAVIDGSEARTMSTYQTTNNN